ncbi:hypothetical protein [uncultured Fibrobacter sp.]|uniref:hypothetical protein n=1 Tax=uncultured Fibrobacter sp. TaxID=261512 RepID=UPI0028051FDB|nr:hypothetical protein [uncultured Fibrobacter sp.]
MKAIFLFLLPAVLSHALTLGQVRAELGKSAIAGDSLEMLLKTTVSSPLMALNRSASVYLVKKGSGKIYSEIRVPLARTRSIVNGNRVKTIDLSTQKSTVSAYDGKSLEAENYADFNPLSSGEWNAPKPVSRNLYSLWGNLNGAPATLYYNAQKKRVEKMETSDSEKSACTFFACDASGALKTMTVEVEIGGIKTTVITEILKLKSSRNFPDKLFEF